MNEMLEQLLATKPLGLDAFSAQLATELAMQLEPPLEIFQRFGVNEEQAKVLLQQPNFQKMVKEAAAEWAKVDNAESRIQYKAKLALEEMLPSIANMAMDDDTPAAARNESAKLFKSLARVGEAEAAGGTGGNGFRIIFNFNNAPDKSITVEGGHEPVEEEDAA